MRSPGYHCWVLLFLLVIVCCSRVNARRGRACRLLPADGCSCRTSFGVMDVSCVDLGLTTIPTIDIQAAAGQQVNLDFSKNYISEIRDGVFDGLRLSKLVIRDRKCEGNCGPFVVHEGAFLGAEVEASLQHVDLSNMSISIIPVPIYSIPDLRILILSNNQIEGLPMTFINLPYLETLHLDGNPISFMSQHVFGSFYKLTTLYITLAPITSGDADENAEISSMISYKDLKSLKSLRITSSNYNFPESLSTIINKQNMPNLESFVCDDCRLKDEAVDDALSVSMESLRILGLPNNLLSDFNEIRHIAQFMPNLEELDLPGNQYADFGSYASGAVLRSLRRLNMRHNQLTSEAVADFREKDYIPYLDFRNNKISTLSISNWAAVFSSETQRVLLGDNPFGCGCEVKDFKEALQKELDGQPGPFSTHEIHNEMTCDYPRYNRGTNIIDLTVRGDCCSACYGVASSVDIPTESTECLMELLFADGNCVS